MGVVKTFDDDCGGIEVEIREIRELIDADDSEKVYTNACE